MNPTPWLLILSGAITGFLIASAGIWWFIHRVIPRRKNEFIQKLAHYAATQLLSPEEMRQKLVSKESFDRLTPTIDSHIDDFLGNKLGKAMPFLGAFIGEKTIKQLKELFMEELALLFPDMMKKYFAGLEQENSIEGVLHDKLGAISAERLESAIKSLLASELRAIKWMGALAGLLIALIQLLIGWLV